MLNISDSAKSLYNEPTKSSSLFPEYVRESGFEIVKFIKRYYEYLNSVGGPSAEINSMFDNHDIDEMSDKYLNAIQLQIAKAVPNSVALDKRRLYKVIYNYYKTRGSEESIHSFFRLFYNEFVSVFYPSSALFDSSSDKSVASDRFVLQDSYYWQKFSYEIRTTNDPSLWINEFIRFVHPAGLKLFVAIVLVMFSSNDWESSVDTYITDFENVSPDDYWKNIDLDKLIRQNSPKWQAPTSLGAIYENGTFLNEIDFLFKVTIESSSSDRTTTYATPGILQSDQLGYSLSVLLDILLYLERPVDFRSEYQAQLKFFDELTPTISGYANYTIAQASESYSDTNACVFNTLSTYTDQNEYDEAFIELGSSSLTDWNKSTIDNTSESGVPDSTLRRFQTSILLEL